MISHELRISDSSIKNQMETLMNGGTVETIIDEQIIFSQLETNPEALWSLFLTSGYLKIVEKRFDGRRFVYTLDITNFEVELMFEDLIRQWFDPARSEYSGFVKALKEKDPLTARKYLSDVLLYTASFYDTARKISKTGKPESFYHGLVLGMVAQERNYRITSNRESGYGRYDVMMTPLNENDPGIIIEFKVFDPDTEKTIRDTADRALEQIDQKQYDAELIKEGIAKENIIHYGMGFQGKDILIKMQA